METGFRKGRVGPTVIIRFPEGTNFGGLGRGWRPDSGRNEDKKKDRSEIKSSTLLADLITRPYSISVHWSSDTTSSSFILGI